MNKIILYLLLLLIFTSHLTAQWAWQNPGPQGNALTDMQFVDSLHGWAIGNYGTIMRTTDAGKNWQIMNSPTKASLLKLYFINKDQGWCSTYYDNNNTFVTYNGGLTWDTVRALKKYYVTDMQFLSSQTGYVLAHDSLSILKTTDGGNSWKKIFSDNFFARANCFFFLDENNGWVGCSEGNLSRTTDGGNTWIRTWDIPGAQMEIRRIQFLDKKTGFMVGITNGYYGDGIYPVFNYTTDGGATWNTRNVASQGELLDGVHFISPTEGYVCSNTIYYTTDQGVNWTKKGASRILAFADKNNAWGVSGPALIVSTKDGWKSTAQQTRSVTPVILWSVSALDTNNIAACGQRETIVTSTDGGKSWRLSYSSDRDINLEGIYYKNTKEIFAVGGNGTLITTNDGGNSWTRRQVSPDLYGEDITFINDSTGFIAGSNINGGLLYTTYDGGISWQKTFEYSRYFNKIRFGTSSLGWIAADRGVLRSTDSGKSWTEMYATSGFGLALDAIGESAWVEENNSIKRTTDAGKSWELYGVLDFAGTMYYIHSISFYDRNNGVTGYGGKIFRTTNGGITWAQDKQITNNTIYSVKYASKDNAWAVGDRGMILHCDADLTGIAENKNFLPSEYRLYQNYPNPFNPQTTIKFSTAKAGMISLKVYDILGQEITTLVNEEKQSGTYSVNFDAGKYRLSSGVYIYRIQANDFSESKKFLLLK